jgi:flagellar biosynthesis protein FlhB
MQTADLILGIISLVLTVSILSYIVAGDNPLFRIAAYLFVGVAAGYVALVVFRQVLLPRLFLPILTGNMNGLAMSVQERVLLLVPLLLGLLLLTKLSPDTARLGNLSMAYLVGVGAAVTVGGVVVGTLLSQSLASINLFPRIDTIFSLDGLLALLYALFVLLGAVTSLFFFYFGARARSRQSNLPARRTPLIETLAKIGQVFIAVTLGALFAGVYVAALSALVERITYLLNFHL